MMVMAEGESIRVKVIRELNQTSDALLALKNPPFEAYEVFDLIAETVEVIEAISPEHIDGPTKLAIAQGVWEWIDDHFNVTKVIFDNLLGSVPKWLKWLIPRKRLMKTLVPFIIELIVKLFNKLIWKAKREQETE